MFEGSIRKTLFSIFESLPEWIAKLNDGRAKSEAPGASLRSLTIRLKEVIPSPRRAIVLSTH